MHYRFRPELPLLRRGPAQVQLGVGRDALILDGVPDALERLLVKLHGVGVSRGMLETTLSDAGLPPAAITRFLAQLEPIMRTGPQHTPAAVAIRGPGAELLATRLRLEGFDGLVWRDEFPEPAVKSRRPRLALELGGYWLPRRRAHAAFSRGVPCLAVTRCDGELTIGPFMVPHVSSCLGCRDEYERARDPLWPTLAEQLISLGQQEAAIEDPLALEVTSRIVCEWMRTGTHPLVGAELRIPRDSMAYVEPRPVHPACSCQADAALGPLPVEDEVSAQLTAPKPRSRTPRRAADETRTRPVELS